MISSSDTLSNRTRVRLEKKAATTPEPSRRLSAAVKILDSYILDNNILDNYILDNYILDNNILEDTIGGPGENCAGNWESSRGEGTEVWMGRRQRPRGGGMKIRKVREEWVMGIMGIMGVAPARMRRDRRRRRRPPRGGASRYRRQQHQAPWTYREQRQEDGSARSGHSVTRVNDGEFQVASPASAAGPSCPSHRARHFDRSG